MAQQLPHVIPSIYLANYLNDFEPLFPRYGVTLRKFSKGDILTQQGVIHNTAYFIKNFKDSYGVTPKAYQKRWGEK